MSLPAPAGGYALEPGAGEAVWFNGGRIVLKATGEQTGGSLTMLEVHARKGFAALLHIHRREDEIFVVLAGDVRVQHGDDVFDAIPGSMIFGPRGVAHSFHVDSAEARLMLIFGPSGVEGFFREGGKPARESGLPPVDEVFLDRQALMEVGARYKQEFVGPPLAPRA